MTMSKRLPALQGWLFSLLRWPSVETTESYCLRAALWWVFLLAPCLHLFASNPAFLSLAHVGTEGRWQMALGLGLALQVVAVLCGNVWMRVGSLTIFGFVWAFVAGLFWASSPRGAGVVPLSTGIGPYAALSLDCFVVANRLVVIWYIDHLAGQALRRRLAEENAAPGLAEVPPCSSPS